MSKQRQRIRNRRDSEPIETLPDEVLERIEAEPEFQRRMEQSDREEREGRWVPHKEVVNGLRSGRKQRR